MYASIVDPARGLACTVLEPTTPGPYPYGPAALYVGAGLSTGAILGALAVTLAYRRIAPHIDDSAPTS